MSQSDTEKYSERFLGEGSGNATIYRLPIVPFLTYLNSILKDPPLYKSHSIEYFWDKFWQIRCFA